MLKDNDLQFENGVIFNGSKTVALGYMPVMKFENGVIFKGTMESLNLKPIKQAKIKCAKKLFNV